MCQLCWQKFFCPSTACPQLSSCATSPTWRDSLLDNQKVGGMSVGRNEFIVWSIHKQDKNLQSSWLIPCSSKRSSNHRAFLWLRTLTWRMYEPCGIVCLNQSNPLLVCFLILILPEEFGAQFIYAIEPFLCKRFEVGYLNFCVQWK